MRLNAKIPSDALVKKALHRLTAIYVLSLVLLLAALEWWGERNWLLAALLYLPPQLWLAPLAVLLPISSWLRPALCFPQIACVALVGLAFLHIRWHARPGPSPGFLTLVTNNYGQSGGRSLEPFLDAENPDLVLLQETGNVLPWRKKFPDRFVQAQGEFIAISKYPIKSASLVTSAKWLGRPVAARFEISFHGKRATVFSVHLPTPRPDFAKLKGLGLLKELAGRNRRLSDGLSFRESMAARIELARSLREVFARESNPFIVAGDFNVPDHGCIYHLFASSLTDAFAHSGRGWGLTFPGSTRNPLTGFGPWMRLDQAFAGKGWEPVFCEAEPRRRSQHRALLAIFRPSGKS